MKETAPGDLDYRSRRTTNPDDAPARAVDTKIQGLMNSALLKVVQFLAIVVVLPIATWYLKSNLEEMREVKAFIVSSQIQTALNKESMARFEAYMTAAQQRGQANIERDTRMDGEMKRLRDDVNRLMFEPRKN